jgi:polyamine oxidase
LAKKWGLGNTYSNYSMIQTYDQNGVSDFAGLLDDYETAYATVEQDAGTILTDNLQDRTMRTGLSIADWKPKKNMQAQAAEWWEFDWEYSYSPDQSSQTFSIIVWIPFIVSPAKYELNSNRTSMTLSTSSVTKTTL